MVYQERILSHFAEKRHKTRKSRLKKWSWLLSEDLVIDAVVAASGDMTLIEFDAIHWMSFCSMLFESEIHTFLGPTHMEGMLDLL
jgi:hypothetical protein